jgi:hypothetical protein
MPQRISTEDITTTAATAATAAATAATAAATTVAAVGLLTAHERSIPISSYPNRRQLLGRTSQFLALILLVLDVAVI